MMWKTAKANTKNKYPQLVEGNLEFIEQSLNEYCELTKISSFEDILENLYHENVVSKDSKLDFNKFKSETDILMKTAGFGDFLKTHPTTSKALGTIGNAALAAGTAMAVAGGVSAVGTGISNLYNKMTRKSKLEKIFKYNPHLRDVDQDRLNQTISDMEDFNPGISKSPIVMGTLLSDAMTEDGIHLDKVKAVADLKQSLPEVKPIDLKLFAAKEPKDPFKKIELKNLEKAYKAHSTNTFDKKTKKQKTWMNSPIQEQIKKEYQEKNSSEIISAANFF